MIKFTTPIARMLLATSLVANLYGCGGGGSAGASNTPSSASTGQTEASSQSVASSIAPTSSSLSSSVSTSASRLASSSVPGSLISSSSVTASLSSLLSSSASSLGGGTQVSSSSLVSSKALSSSSSLGVSSSKSSSISSSSLASSSLSSVSKSASSPSSSPAISSSSSKSASSISSSIASSLSSSSKSISSLSSSIASSLSSSSKSASSLSSSIASSKSASSLSSSVVSSLSSSSKSATSLSSSVASSISSSSKSASSLSSSSSKSASSLNSASSIKSSSSTGSSSSQGVLKDGDVVNGAALYKSKTCSVCHGEQGDSQLNPINMTPYLAGTADLYAVINNTMPKTNPADCVGQCAADIAAYMKTWSSSNTPVVQACGDHITYGARQLKLLTRSEYQNSVEDLVGIDFNAAMALPSDSKIHGFANNIGTAVTQLHETAYFETASKIATWAKDHKFAGIVSCSLTDKTACMNDFTSNFAKKAFRRPLTKGEVSAFQSLFGDNFTNGDVSAGLEMAVTSALLSPAFLYRSEQGIPVSSGPHDGNAYEFSGTTTTLLASDFTDKRWYVAGSTTGALIIGDTSNGRQEAKLGKHITYSGTGTLFQFRMRGVLPKDGSIPVIRYGVGSFSGSITVDWEEFRTISLYFPGLTGTSEFALYLSAGTAQVEVWDFKFGAARARANAPDPDAYALSPYEMATYLSYTFTGSTPDATLMAAAESGMLETDAQVAAQVDRLLNIARAKKQLGDFVAQWMGTDLAQTQPKNMTLYPALTDDIRAAMTQEVRELFTYAALTSNDLKQFFVSDYVHANKTLADYYGLSGANTNQFTRIPGGNQRGGILTTGAFHVAYGSFEETSPIVRAARVREKLLCQDIPPPPAGIAVDRSAAEKKIADIIGAGKHVTQRYRTQLLTEAPYCAQCHEKIINPLGFGLEDYDTIGRYQQQDIWGSMIDASGILHGIESLGDINSSQASFTGGKGLGVLLTTTQSAYGCFVSNAFRFATGEGVEIIDKNNSALGTLSATEKADNQCSVKGITDSMIAANHNPRVAFKSLGTMKQVRYRKEMGR